MSAIENATPLVTTVIKPASNPRDANATPGLTSRNSRNLLAKHDQIPPPGKDSRDHPRGKSRPHSLDTSKEDRPKDKERFRSIGESYDDSFSHSYRDGNHSCHMKRRRDNEFPLCSVSRSDSSDGRYRRSKSKRHKSTDEDDLTKPWMCEEEDPFTPRIRNFKSLRRTRMPNNVKTYDGTGDPEDHVKIFQAAAQVERWAMPTWCHMFNSTLIGATRVWFDELPPESIDSYKDLKAAFLAYFMQQNKYVKYPVEIYNIKKNDGETIEDFMEWFKVETGRMKGAPKCMRISEFMHGVNNPELTKRLNEHVPKTMEEMMVTTTAFIRGEAAAVSKKKGHASWKAHDQSKKNSDKRSDFRGHSREGRGSNRFTPLTRTPKEILAVRAGKFHLLPPIVTPVEKKSNNKCCDFHNDKGHNTDECMQLKKQIEELVRAGKLSHLIKEIKQGWDQSKTGKKETTAKDKPTEIYMIQSWKRTTRQKVTQSFERVKEITFPPLAASSRTEGPLVIEAEMGGHMIHRMYVDDSSSMEILYERCFNRLRPEIKSQMVPATTSLIGFTGETIWPLGQLRLLVIIGDANHSTRAWINFMIVRSLSPYNGIIGRPGIRAIQAVPSTFHGMLKFPVGGGIVTIRSTVLIPTECTLVITSSAVSKEERNRPDNFKVALHSDFPDQEVAIRGTLSDKGRTELCSILKKNLDIFAWQPSDMTRVPQGQAHERAKAIQAEVQKLVEAGIMREVYYHDWLSNPVMVKKHDGSWRMCVDFTDLNKACPQDCYPIPEIDWKVESLCGYPFKCFLDAYKGYHQIQLAELDEEKTAFHTGQGVYCYTKMPFGLKNAGATYQRLMDKAFESQIIQNIEVYFDDLVVKSYTEAKMMRDIEETFRTLRKINMKLNPKKPRMSVKGQILADFFIEMPGEIPQAMPAVETQQEPWILFTDGSSCVDGSGPGLILTNTEGIEFTYMLRFQFAASNNEVEYEALIIGLRIATWMGVKNVHVSVDYKLVANQVLETYVAKEDNMVKYLDKVKSLVSGFTNFLISQVPRSKNKKADALSKIASTSFAYLSKQVLVEVLKDKSIKENEVATMVEKDGLTWMTPIMEYLKEGTLLEDKKEARKLRLKARQYELMEGILYRRSFLTPWLRCVGPLQAEYVIREIHEGSCSMHAGPWSIVAKAIRLGYYWPTMHWDAHDMIRKCNDFTMDYFTKWIEAKAVVTITGGQSNGLVERANRSLREGIKARLEIGIPTYRTTAVDVVSNDEELRLNLDLPGDFVYRSNDASHAVAGGKLRPRWEGHYEVTEALGDGAYKLRSIDGTILPRTWNIANLKRCYL
nr:reverse transcriptase domain-containing protein [Tanacetum cinerariifolium]